MNEVKTINLKENNNTPEYAIYLLDSEINDAKITGHSVIIAIHGYGSSGVGGVIKESVVGYLAKMKKFNKIKEFVEGSAWGMGNPVVKEIIEKHPQLIVNNQIMSPNSGITVVWVQ